MGHHWTGLHLYHIPKMHSDGLDELLMRLTNNDIDEIPQKCKSDPLRGALKV